MKGEFFHGIFWLSLGIIVVLFSSQYSMGTVREPGPGALPFGLGLVFILMAIILLFRTWSVKAPRHEPHLPFGPRWRRVFLIILFLTLVTFLLESMGYLLSIFLLVTISMMIMEPKRLIPGLLLGIISSLFSYILFHVWLEVPLPKGFFPIF